MVSNPNTSKSSVLKTRYQFNSNSQVLINIWRKRSIRTGGKTFVNTSVSGFLACQNKKIVVVNKKSNFFCMFSFYICCSEAVRLCFTKKWFLFNTQRQDHLIELKIHSKFPSFVSNVFTKVYSLTLSVESFKVRWNLFHCSVYNYACLVTKYSDLLLVEFCLQNPFFLGTTLLFVKWRESGISCSTDVVINIYIYIYINK